VKRPKEWDTWTQDEKMKWLRAQRTELKKGGRKRLLTEKDKEKVWSMMMKYRNKSLVAELLGVSRITIIRFLKRFPIPTGFTIEKNIEDYPEIKTFMSRQLRFSGEDVLRHYMIVLRKMYEYMKQKHPSRARPSLWTSDDVNEFVNTFEPYQQHDILVALRQLAKKAQAYFPNIDLALLPTKRTHKARISLAGKPEYYLTLEEIKRMIEVAPTKMYKALIAFLANTACRVGNSKTGKGLIGMKIEDLNLDEHFAKILDKGDITWLVYGLTDETCRLLRDYLAERGEKTGFLFVNGSGNPLTQKTVVKILEEVGKLAGIKGKKLIPKTFRKSFVKNALDEREVDVACLIGTGKRQKTAICVGWTDMKVLMEHYAPKMMRTIERNRPKLSL